MSVGASFLNLLGRDDPRKALLQAVAGASQPDPATGGAPYAGAGAGGAGTDTLAGGDGAGAQPPQPEMQAYKSPPDLSALYGDLLKYSSAENNLNRGFGLIGSSISQDANREATLNAFTGGNSGEAGVPGLDGMASTMMELNKAQIARQQKAATLASLPMIAKRYGLSLEAARYLLDTGKLDAVIAEEEKPNNEFITDPATGQRRLIDKTQVKDLGAFGGVTPKTYSSVELADGTQAPFDPTTGMLGDAQGPKKPNELKPQTLADGTVASYDPLTGKLIGDPMGPKKAEERTPDQKNYDAYMTDEIARGNLRFLGFDDWRMRSKRAEATQINNNEAPKMDPGLEAEKKKRGEKLGENYVNLVNASASASEQLSMFDAVEQGIKSGVRTGLAADAEQTFRKFGQLLGMDTDPSKIAGGELVTAVQNRMALQMRNPESGMGMPGSLSDKDIEFLKAAQIGMGTSAEGNEVLMKVYRRLAERKIELASLADEWVQGKGNGSMMGFGKYASDYNKLHPMFEDLNVGKTPDEAELNSILDTYAPRKK